MPVVAGLSCEWHGDEGLPPLILSPGLGGLGSYWEPNLLSLAQDYRVLVYDHRNCGRSQASDGAESIADMARDLAALIAALDLDEAPALVGHALGGLIGLQLAIDCPGRIARLMVVNGWASIDPFTARCFDTRLALLEQDRRAYVRATPLFLYPPAWVSAHDDALLRAEPDQLAHLPPSDVVAARVHAARTFDPGPYRLGTIACPVMCLATEDDALVPPHCSEKLAALVPNAKYASFSHGGHAVNVTRPDDFNALVQDWMG